MNNSFSYHYSNNHQTMTTTIDELTLLMANMSISTVEEPQDMIIDQNENENEEPTNMEVDTPDTTEPKPNRKRKRMDDDESGSDMMCIDTITGADHEEQVEELTAQFSDMSITVDPVEALANDLAKMVISTLEDKIDELADLFAGLQIAPPDPVDELAIEFGKMAISRVEPVWIGRDDPMEVDDPMNVD